MPMKSLEQQKEEYGILWDRYALELYRFGCFLTGNRERAAVCLEQAFQDGWKSCRRQKRLRLWLYRDLWLRWSGLAPCSRQEKYRRQAEAILYLIHIQHFSSKEAAYVIKSSFPFVF